MTQEQDILSVTQLSHSLKKTLETTYDQLRVRGEISGFKHHTSGHAYFALKDNTAVLDAVFWKGQLAHLSFDPQDGMEVICTGKITTYMGRSKYQIIVSSMDISGEGALLKLLEERKRKFYEEGLFNPDLKKPIPFLPQVIGVITSATGAVIKDILHRLKDRFPSHVLLWPVPVQGKGAEDQVSAAIRGFNTLPINDIPRPDVLIIARGGGSLEDLWCFNEESVVRATAESDIPIIAAVGHETDITLIDYAADRRAPTPTAAAEMAVPVRQELLSQLQDRSTRLYKSIDRYITQHEERVHHLKRGLPDLSTVLGELCQRLDEWAERLHNAMHTLLLHRTADLSALSAYLRHPRDLIQQKMLLLNHVMERFETQYKIFLDRQDNLYQRFASLLESYSYTATLKRGFSIVKATEGHPISQAAHLTQNQEVRLIFQDGEKGAKIL